MAFHENISPVQFFHGSSAWLKPGDTIEPRSPGMLSKDGKNRAYAFMGVEGLPVADPASATRAAGMYASSGRNKAASSQGSLFNPVYEVTPRSKDFIVSTKNRMIADPAGLQVKRTANYADYKGRLMGTI